MYMYIGTGSNLSTTVSISRQSGISPASETKNLNRYNSDLGMYVSADEMGGYWGTNVPAVIGQEVNNPDKPGESYISVPSTVSGKSFIGWFTLPEDRVTSTYSQFGWSAATVLISKDPKIASSTIYGAAKRWCHISGWPSAYTRYICYAKYGAVVNVAKCANVSCSITDAATSGSFSQTIPYDRKVSKFNGYLPAASYYGSGTDANSLFSTQFMSTDSSTTNASLASQYKMTVANGSGTFAGWYTTPNNVSGADGPATTAATTRITNSAAIALTTVLSSAKTYTNTMGGVFYVCFPKYGNVITWNGNGGTFNYSTSTIPAGGAVGTLPAVTKAKPGCYLEGWYTAATGGTKVTTTTVPSGATTYYAQWSGYKVTLDAGGGTVSPSSFYGQSTLPAPVKTGYTFAYWKDKDGNKIGNAGATYAPTAAITLYAVWTADYYELTFDNIFVLIAWRNSDSSKSCAVSSSSGGFVDGSGWPALYTGTNSSIWSEYQSAGCYKIPVEGGVKYTFSCQMVKGSGNYASYALATRATVRYMEYNANGSQLNVVSISSNIVPGDNTVEFTTGSAVRAISLSFVLMEKNKFAQFTNIRIRKSIYNKIVTSKIRQAYQYTPSKTYATLTTPVTFATATQSGCTFVKWTTGENGAGTTVTVNSTVLAANTILYSNWNYLWFELAYDNWFHFWEWKRSSSGALMQDTTASGGATMTTGDGSITITTKGVQNIYTKYGASSAYLNIGVSKSSSYTFSCTLSGRSTSTEVYYVELSKSGDSYSIIKNGSTNYHGMGAVGAGVTSYSKQFTTSASCTHVQLFFDVHAANTTETFSNIKLCATNTYASVSASAVRKSYQYNPTGTYGSLITPTRTGYVFGGWYTSGGGAGTAVTASSELAPRSTTVYSKWTAKTFVFRMYQNHSSSDNAYYARPNADNTAKPTYGSSNYWSIGKPDAWTGRVFAGWWTARTGGEKVWDANGQAVASSYWTAAGSAAKLKYNGTDGETRSFYAHWSVTLTLTISGSVTSITYSLDNGSTWKTTTASKSETVSVGTAFKAYATCSYGYHSYESSAANAMSRTISESYEYKPATLANTYVFKFDPNGGTFRGSTGVTQFPDSASPTKPTYNALSYRSIGAATRTGYHLVGWYVKKTGYTDIDKVWDANGYAVKGNYWTDSYANAGKWKYDPGNEATITFYAQWSINYYYIFVEDGYDHNSIQDPVEEIKVKYGDSQLILPLTRTGHEFAGWKVTSGLDTATARWGEGEFDTPNPITSSETLIYSSWVPWVYVKNLTSLNNRIVEMTAQWDIVSHVLTLKVNQHVSQIKYSLNGGATWDWTISNISLAVEYGSSVKAYAVVEDGFETQYGSEYDAWSATMADSDLVFSPEATGLYYEAGLNNLFLLLAWSREAQWWMKFCKVMSADAQTGDLSITSFASKIVDTSAYIRFFPEDGTVFCGASGPSLFYLNVEGGTECQFSCSIATSSASWGIWICDIRDNETIARKYWISQGTGANANVRATFTTASDSTHLMIQFFVLTANATATFSAIKVCPSNPYGKISIDMVRKPFRYPQSIGSLPQVSRVGYEWLGWAYANGMNVYETDVLHESQTIYTRWYSIRYLVSYELNGGIAPSYNPAETRYDRVISVNSPAWADASKVFAGWVISTGLNADTAVAGSSRAAVESFDRDGGGDAPMGAYAVTSASQLCRPAGKGVVYFKNLAATNNQTVILTATWQSVTTITVTFVPNGGKFTDPIPKFFITVMAGSPYCSGGQTFPNVENESHELLGWFDAEGNLVGPKDIAPANNVVLYAKWDGTDSYSLTFRDLSGENEDYELQVLRGLPFKLPTVASMEWTPKPGWSFPDDMQSFWNISPYFNGTAYGDGETISTDLTELPYVFLYANWKRDSYTIVLNANGGMVRGAAEVTMDVLKGVNYAALPNASWRGHTFSGWYTAVSGGEKVTAASVPSADGTLFAHWDEEG